MSGDDDRVPMLEHVMATTSSLSSNVTPEAAAVKHPRRSVTLILAAVTFILFTCAFVFLVVSLIIPVLHSLDVEHVSSSNSSDVAAEAGHSMTHDHGRRRSVQQLVENLQQLVAVCLAFLFYIFI